MSTWSEGGRGVVVIQNRGDNMSTRSESGRVVVVVIQHRETTCQHGLRAGG